MNIPGIFEIASGVVSELCWIFCSVIAIELFLKYLIAELR
jgi:hypothetical protein